MLVQMSGKSGSTHAIIRVICHLQTDDVQVHEAKVNTYPHNMHTYRGGGGEWRRPCMVQQCVVCNTQLGSAGGNIVD